MGAIADAFEQGLADAFASQKVGDPLHEDVDIGPLATPGILAELDQQVKTCLAMGATVLVGGDVAALKAQLPERLQTGNFYPPTVLAAIPPGTPADQEEFFWAGGVGVSGGGCRCGDRAGKFDGVWPGGECLDNRCG